MTDQITSNQLGQESSSYLKQHQDNPVHWYPYGEEALKKAQELERPIFLSIGYSSCHWCHVMAHESFSDEATAKFLNDHFICIKVDREEYPDIDAYYQQASQLYIQAGGWPLSAFLTPDTRPFFVGTYFPKEKKGEGATFMELIQELSRAYEHDREQVENNATEATKALARPIKPEKPIEFPGDFPAPMAIVGALQEHSDKEHGGHGVAPKFPHFAYYEWCVEQLLEGTISREAGDHIIQTIDALLFGGVYDHARGGIHRYSTDDKYLVPHFEKMLYDQAGLLRLMAKTSRLYQAPHVFDAIMDTLDYLDAEMLSDEGYLFSAQDADSEGMEGLYFTFTKEEFETILNEASDEDDDLTKEMDYFLDVFRIEKDGNFEQGLNVISLNPAKKDQIFTPDGWEKVRRIRAAILNARKGRIPPATDTKGIASWNAHLICALTDVMQYCPIDVIKNRAGELFQKVTEGFFKTFLVQKDDNKMKIRHTTTVDQDVSYFEDYVFFSEAQLRIYEMTANPVFKDNFRDSLNYIKDEFLKEDHLATRSISNEESRPYPNMASTLFDTSFKSAAMSFVSLVKRARILFKDEQLIPAIDSMTNDFKQTILMNPLASGEGMRAFTYPQQVYRVLQVPKLWLNEPKYLEFSSQLLPRFVLDYNQDESDEWSICNFKACEMQGKGLESFIEALTPKEDQAENNQGQS